MFLRLRTPVPVLAPQEFVARGSQVNELMQATVSYVEMGCKSLHDILSWHTSSAAKQNCTFETEVRSSASYWIPKRNSAALDTGTSENEGRLLRGNARMCKQNREASYPVRDAMLLSRRTSPRSCLISKGHDYATKS